MSDIQRSLNTVSGNITVTSGDVIVSDPTKGIVMIDNTGDDVRVKVVDDGGVKTLEVSEVP